jgi:Rrf2 family protein
MRISAKTDYAVRAVLELAATDDPPLKRDEIAAAQAIPVKFLESILSELKHGGVVMSQRGAEGGYWLAKPAEEITVAEVMRVVEGPLASVRERRPEEVEYDGSAAHLQEVWVALRANMRGVLESVSLADVVDNDLPREILDLTDEPESWVSH